MNEQIVREYPTSIDMKFQLNQREKKKKKRKFVLIKYMIK